MPLYEYKCEKCGDIFEVMQKFADDPVTVHEKCGGNVERLISAPSFHFKGSGFYITDYGKGGGKPADNGASQKPDSAGSKSSSGAESGASSTPASPSSGESKPASSDVKPSSSSSKASTSEAK